MKAWYKTEDLAGLSEAAKQGRLKVPRDLRLTEVAHQTADKIDWFAEGLRYAEVVEADAQLVEAHSSQPLGQLLRAGLNTLANSWYDKTESTYQAYTSATQSSMAFEFYAPKMGATLPRPFGKLSMAKNANVAFGNRVLENQKFGSILEIETELEEDDQSGQIATLGQDLGENTKIFEEAYAAGRLAGQAFTIGSDAYAASSFTTTNSNGTGISYPFDDQLYSDLTGNTMGNGTHGRTGGVDLTTVYLATLRSKLLLATNSLGVKIAVSPDRLIVGARYDNKMRVLLNATWYPGVPGASGQTVTTAASGVIPGFADHNPFKALYQGYCNVYLPESAWFINRASKALTVQRRTPWAIVMENPNTGDSFSYDKLRWKTRGRLEMDYVDSRFSGMGNDGTVAGTY